MLQQQRVPQEYNDRSKPFGVDAGKIEGEDQQRNSKYCDSFATLEEALVAIGKCEGYHYIDLVYIDDEGRVFNIDLTPVQVEV